MDQLSLFDTAPDPQELDAAEEQQVAIVVFTDAPHGPYDYRVLDEIIDKLKPGQRIQVPLGRGNQLRTGY